MPRSDGSGAEVPFQRYALYWAPEHDSPLGAFGRSWLGHDAEPPAAISQRNDFGLGLDCIERLTRAPRRYGFHATILAPFHLSADAAVDELKARAERFASRRRPICIGRLGIRALGDFLALTPTGSAQALTAFHTECAFAFDRFRAPLSKSDRTRRSQDQLSLSQRLMLAQWGYPYMLSQYRFHLTLTGPLDAAELEPIRTRLADTLESICQQRVTMESLSLFGDPGQGDTFRLIARYPLQR